MRLLLILSILLSIIDLAKGRQDNSFQILQNNSWLEAENIDHPFYQIPDSLATAPDYGQLDLTPYFLEITNEIGAAAYHFKELDTTYNDHKWYYLELQGNGSGHQDYVLRTMNKTFGKIYLYEVNEQYDTLLRKAGGLVPPGDLDFIHSNRVRLSLTLGPNEKKQLYIVSFEGTNASYLDPAIFSCRLEKREIFTQLLNYRNIKSYILVSIFLSLFIYNFLLFLTLRDRIYLIYLAFLFSWGVFDTGEHWMPYLIPLFYEVRIMYIFLNLGYLFFIIFQSSFLSYQKNGYPKFLTISRVLVGIHLLYLLPAILQMVLVTNIFNNLYYEELIIITGLASLMTLLYQALILTRKGIREARYFLFANSILFLTYIIATVSHTTYLFGPNFLSNKLYEWEFTFLLIAVGLLTQAILFSLALGQKMLGLERDKAKAVHENLLNQQELNVKLETKVQQRTADLDKRNQENELLLGEVHHRVKNNLQIISSLLNLQSRQLNDVQAKSAVQEGRNRVKAMALVHQKLYQNKEFASIQMEEYISHLVDNLLQTHDLRQKDIKILLQIPAIRLDTDTAMSVGLILNELVSNALKHGLSQINDKKLEIHMEISDTELTLKVIDNGKGMPPNFKIEEADSFGLKLVRSLSQELDGDITFSNGPGTHVEVKIHDFSLVVAEKSKFC